MSTQPTSTRYTRSKSTITCTNRSTTNSPYHRRRNCSPYPIPEFYSQEIEDDFDDEVIDNHRFLSQQVQQKFRPRTTTGQAIGCGQSPATKRKFGDVDLTNELLHKIDVLTDQVMDLNKKYEDGVDEMRKLRKTNEKLEKLTYSIAKTHKYDVVENEKGEELPVVLYEQTNLLVPPIPPTPTALLCHLIRKLYSKDEIVKGIEEGPRLESIKKAICAAFYGNDPIKFEVFWNACGSKCYKAQARAQRHRDKQNRSNEEAVLVNDEN